jgi:hypothetical protein
MRRITTGVVAVAGAAGGLAVGRALRARRGSSGPTGGPQPGGRWHVLTVNLPQEQVAPGGRLPDPLSELGDAVEVRLRPAPGDRGTEIAVRLRAGEPSGVGATVSRLRGDDPRWAVRRALRESRSLLETGEVLRPSQPPTTERTLLSRPLEYATKHGREEGLL